MGAAQNSVPGLLIWRSVMPRSPSHQPVYRDLQTAYRFEQATLWTHPGQNPGKLMSLSAAKGWKYAHMHPLFNRARCSMAIEVLSSVFNLHRSQPAHRDVLNLTVARVHRGVGYTFILGPLLVCTLVAPVILL